MTEQTTQATQTAAELQAQLQELEAQLQAAKAAAKAEALDQAVALMKEFGITARELTAIIKEEKAAAVAARKEARAAAKAATSEIPADPAVIFTPAEATGEVTVIKAEEIPAAPF